MFIERNVFYLKFGMAGKAVPMWKAYLEKAVADGVKARLLTDLTGSGYVVVLELAYETYAELEPSRCSLVARSDWKAFYAEFISLCERSERTLYKEQVAF